MIVVLTRKKADRIPDCRFLWRRPYEKSRNAPCPDDAEHDNRRDDYNAEEERNQQSTGNRTLLHDGFCDTPRARVAGLVLPLVIVLSLRHHSLRIIISCKCPGLEP